MVTLTLLAFFSMLVLIIMAIFSNTGETATEEIEYQIWLFNCPDPIYHGTIEDIQDIIIDGFQISNYTIVQDEVSSDFFGFTTSFNGTQFTCSRDSVTGEFQLLITIKEYGKTVTNFPIGWFGYVGDVLSNVGLKLQVFGTLVMFILTPANFSILGFTLADLSGVSAMFVIGVYIFCYIFIGIWIYKMVSPFSGGGG